MALPSSGAITMAMVAAEIGISASGLSLNDSRVRELAKRPSGAIGFNHLYGKAWLLPPTISLARVYDAGVIDGRYTFSESVRPRVYYNLGGGASSVTAQVVTKDNNVRSLTLTPSSGYISITASATDRALGRFTLRVTASNASGSSYFDVLMTVRSNTNW